LVIHHTRCDFTYSDTTIGTMPYSTAAAMTWPQGNE